MRFLRSSTGPVSLQGILEVSTIRSHHPGSVGRPRPTLPRARPRQLPARACANASLRCNRRSALKPDAAVDLRGDPLLQKKEKGEWPAVARVAALRSRQSVGFLIRNASGSAAHRPEEPCRSGSRKRAHGPPLEPDRDAIRTNRSPTDQSAPRRPHSNESLGDPTHWDPARDAAPRPASDRVKTGETRIQSRPMRPEVAEDAHRAPGADRDPEPAPASFKRVSTRGADCDMLRSGNHIQESPRSNLAVSGMMHEELPWH